MIDFEPRNSSKTLKQSETTGRDSDERSETERIAGASRSNEVIPKKVRRRFSASDKLKILAAADRCTKHGEIGALLRREGIYSNQLQIWRQQRSQGELGALSGKKRGRKPNPHGPLVTKLAESEKLVAKLMKRLEKAETIISFQKKFLEMFGEMPSTVQDETKS
jgi:transposase-like protein